MMERGVAIGFNSQLLTQIVCDETYGFTKVIYKEKTMKEFLNKALIERLQWAIDSSIDENTNKIIDNRDLFANLSKTVL